MEPAECIHGRTPADEGEHPNCRNPVLGYHLRTPAGMGEHVRMSGLRGQALHASVLVVPTNGPDRSSGHCQERRPHRLGDVWPEPGQFGDIGRHFGPRPLIG